jgi:hypothetical protein
MKRRNFLKGVALAALSPLAAMQPKEAAAAQATTEGCPAAVERGLKVYESDPQKVGAYTKRLTSLMKAAMRNMGEQSAEAARSAAKMRDALTDIYINPEAMEDIRAWGVDEIDCANAMLDSLEIMPQGRDKDEKDYVAYTTPGVTKVPDHNIIGPPVFVDYGCAIMDNRRVLNLKF